MSLSEILWDLHHSSDVGNAVEGLAELAETLEKQIPDYERQLSDERMKSMRLETERDALAAKLSMVIAAWNGSDYDAINAEINKTPQQCLAEIKAEAGRAGFVAGRLRGVDYFKLTEAQAADEYAAKIRKGGE